MISGAVVALLTAAVPLAPGPRAEAEAAERRGDTAAADVAAERYLDQAAVSALTAAWGVPDGPSVADAAAALTEASVFVATLSERHANDSLLIRALAWSPGQIDRFRAAALRALGRSPYLASSWLPAEDVDRLAAGDPTLPYQLASSGSRVPDRGGAKAAGLAGFRWLESELARVRSATDRDNIRRVAETLVVVDPDNVPALIALARLQADPRRLAKAGLDRREVANAWARDSRTLMVLGRALADDPGDTYVRVELAWRQLQAGLAEDARREAKKVAASPAASREARRAGDVIENMAALELGHGAVFLKWWAARGVRSPSIEQWLVTRFNDTTGLPDAVSSVRREALRRMFVPAPPAGASFGLTWSAQGALKDQKLDPAVRKGALDTMVAELPALAPVARSCSTERLALEACQHRIELANDLDHADDDEDGRVEIDTAALPATLGTRLDIPPRWLDALTAQPAEKLAGLSAWLDQLRSRPVAKTSAFARLDVLVRWARKDVAGAARALDRAPPLPPAERLALRLLAGDIASGVVAPERAPALAHPPSRAVELVVKGATTDPVPQWMEQSFAGKDRLTALRRAEVLLTSGYPGKALVDLRPLLGVLDGADRAEVAGFVFLAAHAAKDAVLEQRAAAEVQASAPDSDVAAMIAAMRAAGPGGAAVGAAARWFRLAPSSRAAASAFFAAVATRKDPRPVDASARDLLIRAAKIVHGAFAPAAAVAGVNEANSDCWRAALATADLDATSFARQCPLAAAKALLRLDMSATHTAQRRVAEARDGAAIVAAARGAAVLAELAQGDQRSDDTPAWLWFVAGDYEKSRAALKTAESSASTVGKDRGEVDDNEALRLLLTPTPIADPRGRREQFRRFVRTASVRDGAGDEGGDDLGDEARARKARNERERDTIWHVACLASARTRRSQATLAACGQAWKRGRRTAATAAALGTVLFDKIEDARKQGLEVRTFLDQANAALGGRLPGALRAREGAWLVSHGRMREAAGATEQAWLTGGGLVGEGLDESALGTAPFNPVLARYRAAVGGSRTHHALALTLASIAAAEIDVANGYVVQARAFYNHETDSHQERILALFEELLALIDADLRTRALDAQGITRLVSRFFDSTRKDPVRDIAKDYPRSALGSVLVVEEAGTGPNPASEVEHMKALLARFPKSGLIANDAAFLFRKAGLIKEAVAAWNAGRAARPDSPFMRGTFAETAVVPTSLATAEAHAKALAAPIDIPASSKALRLVEDADVGFSAVIPAGYQPGGGASGVAFTKDGANIIFMRIPRVTYCEGLACLDQLVPGFEQNGLKLHWRRIFTTPIGPGAEAFLVSGMGTLLVAAIPVGGHLYLVMMGGPGERVQAETSALRMAYATFRPDDLVLPQGIARKLRTGWRDARSVLRVRALLAKPGGHGCPLSPLLDVTDVGAPEPKSLLLDAFMTTPWAATRLDLLRCEPVDASASPGVTLAAAWDEDQRVRLIGAARVAAQPAAVLAEARTLMHGDTPIEPPAGSRVAARDHRWVALLLALPPKERAELARVLLRRDEAHLRAVGLLAPRLADIEVSAEHLRILRDGSATDARIATQALPEALTRQMREAIWSRLDRAKRPADKTEADALFEIASRLAKDPDRGNRPRIARVARLASGPGGDRARAEALLSVRPDAAAPIEGAPLLAVDRPLSDVLPGRRWSFIRIGRPALLLQRLSRLGHRLSAPNEAQQRIAQTLIANVVGEIDMMRANAGSLDLDRAIDCAALDGNTGQLLCTGSTRPDLPDDFETTLRALSLLQDVSSGALGVPIVLPGLPFLLHETVYAKGDTTQEGQDAALLRERAERAIALGEAPGATAAWKVRIGFAPDGSGAISDQIVLRKNNRLFFSNSRDLARRFLLAGPAGAAAAGTGAPALGADADFQRMSARFVADADLTAIVMPGDGADDDKHPVTLELSVTARGIATRFRLHYKPQATDAGLGALWRLMPLNPTLVFGASDIGPVASVTGRSHEGRPMFLSKVEGAGLEPPTWLANATRAALFGWYPREGGRLWDDWLTLVTWDDRVAGAWRRHGLPAPAPGGGVGQKDGYHFKRVGAVLVISNADVLVNEAIHRGATEAAPAPGHDEPVKGSFDGTHVASSLDDRADRAPSTQAGMALRTYAALSAVAKTATLGSAVSRDGSEVVIESLLSPAVEGSGGLLVEEWQQESRLRNTLHLPRSLTAGEADRPIRFVVEVERDEQARRAFPVTARQKLEQVAPGRWRLQVTPGPAFADPVPAVALSAADRHRYTDASGVAPRIRSAANEIVRDKTPPKEAARSVLAWMKRNMTYELTPRELRDDVILERRRGDCSEYSKLTIALLRAKGIPARMRVGFLADAGELVAHAWVEFHDGTGWREIDPTEGTASADARHLDASLVDVMSLLSLAQIKVAGIE